MADVIIRFSIYSRKEKSFSTLEKLLRKPDKKVLLGVPIVLADGRNTGKTYQETAYSYRYEFKAVNDLEICNSKWFSEWEKDQEILKSLQSEYGFNLYLNYEITVYEDNFPSLYFQPRFLAFLGNTSIEFSIYFYQN